MGVLQSTREQIQALWEQSGEIKPTQQEIAEKLGVSKSTVSYHMIQLGIHIQEERKGIPRKRKRNLQEEIRQLWEQSGEKKPTRQEIAKQLGIHESTVKKYCKTLHIHGNEIRKMRNFQMSQEIQDRIQEIIKQADPKMLTQRYMAEQLNMSVSTINQYMKKMGINTKQLRVVAQRNGRGKTGATKKRIQELWEQGGEKKPTQKEIAKQLGVTESCVSGHIRTMKKEGLLSKDANTRSPEEWKKSVLNLIKKQKKSSIISIQEIQDLEKEAEKIFLDPPIMDLCLIANLYSNQKQFDRAEAVMNSTLSGEETNLTDHQKMLCELVKKQIQQSRMEHKVGQMKQKGYSAKDIAEQVGLSEIRVIQIMKKGEQTPKAKKPDLER